MTSRRRPRDCGRRVIVEPVVEANEPAWQLVEAILHGIEEPADRARWVRHWLPRTAAILGIEDVPRRG